MEKIKNTLPDDAHYVRHVTDMGDKHPVVASEHIENADGMRLVRAGTRVNSELFDKLVRHKLLKPLDSSLSAEDAVIVSTLLNDAKRMLSQEPCLGQMVELTPHREPLRVLGAVSLNEALSFKLTVCREQAWEKYNHLLRVALASVFLGDHLRLSDTELVQLATAGLFHDLGELHVDPKIFSARRPLSPAERRQIYAHPYVAYLILKSFPQYHPHISTAVLDHHERIDGSGYPRGLRGDAVSSMGLMLAVTELVVVMLGRTHSRPDPRCMASQLKLNVDRFGQPRIAPFVELMVQQGCGFNSNDLMGDAPTAEALHVRLSALGAVLELPGNWPTMPEADFIAEQLEKLRYMARCIGVSADSAAELVAMLRDDAEGLVEMEYMARELSYQVATVIHEVERRWPQQANNETVQRWMRAALSLIESPMASATGSGD